MRYKMVAYKKPQILKPYIVTYINDDDELKEKLVYAVDADAASKIVDSTISVKEWEKHE